MAITIDINTVPDPNYGRANINLPAHTRSEVKSPVARYWRFVNQGPGSVATYTLDPDEDTVCSLAVGEQAVWWKGPVVLQSLDDEGATGVEFASDLTRYFS